MGHCVNQPHAPGWMIIQLWWWGLLVLSHRMVASEAEMEPTALTIKYKLSQSFAMFNLACVLLPQAKRPCFCFSLFAFCLQDRKKAFVISCFILKFCPRESCFALHFLPLFVSHSFHSSPAFHWIITTFVFKSLSSPLYVSVVFSVLFWLSPCSIFPLQLLVPCGIFLVRILPFAFVSWISVFCVLPRFAWIFSFLLFFVKPLSAFVSVFGSPLSTSNSLDFM